jgi:hypothetical protein
MKLSLNVAFALLALVAFGRVQSAEAPARGPGLFAALLTIADDGRVQDIEFERARD